MEYRRKRGDIIQAYKILKKVDRINRFQSELRRHAFSQRIIDDWKSLTEKIVNLESLDIFKGRLDKHWSTELFKTSTE